MKSLEEQYDDEVQSVLVHRPAPFRIDATAALKALGITHEVKFLNADLNDGSPEMADIFEGGVTNAATVPPGNLILLDWNAISFSQNERRTRPDDDYMVPDPAMVTDPATIIAHELVHVQQLAGKSVAEGVAAYKNAARGEYEKNLFEQDALKRSLALAPLVKLTPNK